MTIQLFLETSHQSALFAGSATAVQQTAMVAGNSSCCTGIAITLMRNLCTRCCVINRRSVFRILLPLLGCLAVFSHIM